jgi:hypothetical protein
MDRIKKEVKSFFGGGEKESKPTERRGRSERRESRVDRSSRRSSILPTSSVFSTVDPILCMSQNKDPKELKKSNQQTPRVIRRGKSKMRRSMKHAVGNSIGYMSEVSSVSYSGPTCNYQYTFKLKYGTIPNYDED